MAAAAAVVHQDNVAAAPDRDSSALIDVHVHLSRWPARRLPLDDTSALVSKLRKKGVTQACAGSFDALLHKDLAAVNGRLTADCRQARRGFLVPVGGINPKLPDWEEELQRCVESHRMPGIRVYPGYHDYRLDDAAFARLLDLASRSGLFVQIVLAMEDERTMHRLLQVPRVDPAPLTAVLGRTRGARVMLLNGLGKIPEPVLRSLLDAGEVYFDFAMLEGVGGVSAVLRKIPLSRLVFGSHAPLFYLESALLKLKESSLSGDEVQAIRHRNAERLVIKD